MQAGQPTEEWLSRMMQLHVQRAPPSPHIQQVKLPFLKILMIFLLVVQLINQEFCTLAMAILGVRETELPTINHQLLVGQ